jgi:DNA-binding CsgD family transcriptional regulator
VWVLRRTNHSYDDIALALYITVNTVKRHLKSIYAKRKQVLDDRVN